MTPAEKLKRIRARCVELLAIAEKRTPGKWNCMQNTIETRKGDVCIASVWSQEDDEFTMPNGSFIAACAGHAEAGWRSTIAAIDHVKLHNFTDGDIERAILSAWPDELF